MKLLTILGAVVVVAAGGAAGMYSYSELCCSKPVDPETYPVVRTGGCPHCAGLTADSSACQTQTAAKKADSCCATPCAACTPVCDGCPVCVFDCSACCGGSAAVAVAGPAALFTPASKVKAESCCSAKAVAKKADCCPTGACCPDGPCCALPAVTGIAAVVTAKK